MKTKIAVLYKPNLNKISLWRVEDIELPDDTPEDKLQEKAREVRMNQWHEEKEFWGDKHGGILEIRYIFVI